MDKTRAFLAGLVAPTGPPRLFCHIEIMGMGLFLGELGPGGNYLLVEGARAREFSYPDAYAICPQGTFGIFHVEFKCCRRTESLV